MGNIPKQILLMKFLMLKLFTAVKHMVSELKL